MKVSAKIDYACRALIELSLRWPDRSPLPVREIAQRHKISMKFLVHVLIGLKQLGLVESIRGKKGGYVLAKSPEEIRLSEIIRHFGGLGYTLTLENTKKENHHVMDSIWQEIDETMKSVLDGINMETIINQERSKGDSVIYEI